MNLLKQFRKLVALAVIIFDRKKKQQVTLLNAIGGMKKFSSKKSLPKSLREVYERQVIEDSLGFYIPRKDLKVLVKTKPLKRLSVSRLKLIHSYLSFKNAECNVEIKRSDYFAMVYLFLVPTYGMVAMLILLLIETPSKPMFILCVSSIAAFFALWVYTLAYVIRPFFQALRLRKELETCKMS